MANLNPNPATRWKPGQSGNPNGRPKGALTGLKVSVALGKFWEMTRAELMVAIQDPNTSMGDIIIASVMVRAAKDGDANRLNILLDRAIGRVREAPIDPPEQSDAASIPAEERQKRIEALLAKK